MKMRSETSHSATKVRVEKSYWLKTDEPQRPWWPWGLLPLLGLFLLYLYGATRGASAIEADVEKNVARHLQDQAVKVLGADGNGQKVRLSAEGTTSDAKRIIALAKSTQCDTWAGDLICPTTIDLDLKQAAVKQAPVVVQAKPVANYFHDFKFTKSGSSLRLAGEVPNDRILNNILKLAQAEYKEVDNRLTVSSKNAKDGYNNAYTRALEVLNKLERGEASHQRGVLNVSGQVSAENDSAARMTFNNKNNVPTLGTLSLQTIKAANTCNQEFRQQLSESTINFATGSAAISNSSQGLLRALAALANQCPGNLLIEGHTDSSGNDASNQILSQNRADAVRNSLAALGVDAKRLQARGYGESKPIADNATATGRAKNRRIVISIAQ